MKFDVNAVCENPSIDDPIGIKYEDDLGHDVLMFGVFCGMDRDKYVIREPHGNGLYPYYTYVSGKLAKLNPTRGH